MELNFSASCWVEQVAAACGHGELHLPFSRMGESGLCVRAGVTEQKAEVPEFCSTVEVSHTWR